MSNRIYWIDHARGLLILVIVITIFLPMEIREGYLRFILAHPENERTTTMMDVYDVGAAALMVIMGIMMPYSFSRRRVKDGDKKATLHMIGRYGLLFALGVLITVLLDGCFFLKIRDGELVFASGIPVVCWDILQTLGFIGLFALPFLYFEVKPKFRAITATGMLTFYQFMLIFGGWREYAIETYNGGLFGTIFGYSALFLYSTCVGEFLLLKENYSEKKKHLILIMLTLSVLIGGLLLSFAPELYANRRQVTITYILMSLGVSLLGVLICMGIDKVLRKSIIGLDSFGKSPFLFYIIALLVDFLIFNLLLVEKTIIESLFVVILFIVVVIYLDKKEKVLKI